MCSELLTDGGVQAETLCPSARNTVIRFQMWRGLGLNDYKTLRSLVTKKLWMSIYLVLEASTGQIGITGVYTCKEEMANSMCVVCSGLFWSLAWPLAALTLKLGIDLTDSLIAWRSGTDLSITDDLHRLASPRECTRYLQEESGRKLHHLG